VEGYTSTNGETVTSSYEVTIPAEINIGKDNLQGTLDLKAKLTYFGHNENLYIHVSSANEFKLQEKSGSSQMSYELSESNTPLSNNGYLVASVTDSTKDTGFATNATYNWVKTLTAKITGPAYAGNYTDTLTFTVSQSASN
jgi:hypothetical protein